MITLSHTKMSVIALVKRVLDHYAIPYHTYDTIDGRTIHNIEYAGEDMPEEAFDEIEDLCMTYNM